VADISVDRQACIRCGACVEVCFAARVFEMTEDGAEAARPKACWACGHCIAVCPTDAIDHDLFPLEECPIVDRDDLPSAESLVSAFRFRRSVRAFQQKQVAREIVRELVSIGRWAPTASNNQALDWIAFDDRARIVELAHGTVEGLLRFAKLARNPFVRPVLRLAVGGKEAKRARKLGPAARRMSEALANGIDPIFYRAPVVLIGHTQKGNLFGRDDAVYAMYNMMLACESLDLATCQIGFFQAVVSRTAKLRGLLALPPDRVPQVAFALGYPTQTFRRVPMRRVPELTWNPRG
jgi:nitroreductase/NAD-dependent dihydropyrimidine dehydrogenase PreA subunit